MALALVRSTAAPKRLRITLPDAQFPRDQSTTEADVLAYIAANATALEGVQQLLITSEAYNDLYSLLDESGSRNPFRSERVQNPLTGDILTDLPDQTQFYPNDEIDFNSTEYRLVDGQWVEQSSGTGTGGGLTLAPIGNTTSTTQPISAADVHARFLAARDTRERVTTPVAGIAKDESPQLAEIQALVDANSWTAERIIVVTPLGIEHVFTNLLESGNQIVRFDGIEKFDPLTDIALADPALFTIGDLMNTIDATGNYERWVIGPGGTWTATEEDITFRNAGAIAALDPVDANGTTKDTAAFLLLLPDETLHDFGTPLAVFNHAVSSGLTTSNYTVGVLPDGITKVWDEV